MKTPSIITGRTGTTRYWHVGDCFLSAFPAAPGWDVRVRNRRWGETELLLDGRFATEADAEEWCRRMAVVLARDQADD
jgi:hypothetical protein